MTVELVVDQMDLLKAEQALTNLQAENLIRPEMAPFGEAVTAIMKVYPSAGIVLKSSQQYRQERASARSLGKMLGLGGALAGLVSKQTSGKGPGYKRTYKYSESWTATLEGLNEHIVNDAPYSGFVGGLDASPGGKSGAKGNQPYTWRYGWQRLKKVAEDTMDEWIVRIERKAFRLWER